MQTLIIKLSDGTIFRYQRASGVYDGVVLEEVLAKHAAITGTPFESVPVDSALIDSALLAGVLAEDLDVVDGAVVIATLVKKKREAFAAVDATTKRRILAGFSYGGQTFSLSDAAQQSLLGFWNVRESATYPLSWPTKDNAGWALLDQQPDFEAFYAAAFAKVRTERDAGAAVKSAIASATTVEAVDAALATDTR